ncbi:AFR277Wp [Eremothecium gossypii ATCC 10895]|uniref:AFR277Wp n=1 Tax=Eremothecium gossypii (strain ATCC 10895 / CBS 109.51 / FGSC 9923 / NRRL Y-1056) TaxID=284811 RepID=Q753N5_EREGS|nr:AFR277Wp [Eremothecium gossypii ATCC 10895]AAS53648.1 AFR277Wp [Eremothecium gossypii ATCC 10895]AEY97961.1 FAFR277Wp [Eremothecium gossypii FDAG1]
MSAISDSDTEADVVSRNLCGVVDIGSNGIRFSISSKASHHARIMPCVFKDRVGISLFEVQHCKNSLEKIPIPVDTIKEVCAAMKRFKLICDDFGVPETAVRVVATEATREALNAQEFVDAIRESTGWLAKMLTREEEGRIGSYGVISSFNAVSGLYMDLGGGSVQLSWVSCQNGEIKHSSTPVSLPYGAGALSRRMHTENKRDLFMEIKCALQDALPKIGIPHAMIAAAKSSGGFELFTCGGGLRAMGYLLLSQIKEYPIKTVINGFSCSSEEFLTMSDLLFLKGKVPGHKKDSKIFKVSQRRAQQLPAVGLLMSAALESLPKINIVHFSEGGVREGTLYSILPREIRAQDPLIIATRPYAPLLASKYLELLKAALPESDVPALVIDRIAPALCNLAFVHASYAKELQPTAALHVATTGIIAGCHGLSHRIRALIGIALCNRWGADIPKPEEAHKKALEEAVLRDSGKPDCHRTLFWTKYVGFIMFLICGVHPGGNIRDGVFTFDVHRKDDVEADLQDLALGDSRYTKSQTSSRKPVFEVVVKISRDDLKTSASVRQRIITLQKRIRRLSRGSTEKVKVGVQFSEAC